MGAVCPFRYEVSQLLHRLWARPDCRESILRECGKKKFQVCVVGLGWFVVCWSAVCMCIVNCLYTKFAHVCEQDALDWFVVC